MTDTLHRVITHMYRSATLQALRNAWTGSRVARPENRKRLQAELDTHRRLGSTGDGKSIYLIHLGGDCALRREIGRLRELSFRRVGEGTGKAYDLDEYDDYYEHLLLWDDDAREVVGAYRIAQAGSLIRRYGLEALYTASLFDFDPRFEPFFEHGLELGRSFIQPRYWGSRGLDCLWYGIGAYLMEHPRLRYLFGPVSISAQLPEKARHMLVYFFRRHFGAQAGVVSARRPLRLSETDHRRHRELFSGFDYNRDLKTLKKELSALGVSIPVLYKQYAGLCEREGVRFFDFSVDQDFGRCIDGFIMLDLSHLKARKRDRYLTPQPDQAAA
ncbi:MAG: GNAT family N-acetyltransferase [Gammaproteobacteria bacterium]|nr:MAG: GNAT family N-acetyltransferase [Gammaproteobacteria bacterium]